MSFIHLITFAFLASWPSIAFGQIVEWREAVATKDTWNLIQNMDRLDSGSKQVSYAALDLVEKLVDTQPRAALQYLNQAYALQPTLADTFDYYKFKVFYKIGDYDQAMTLGTKLLNRPILRTWQVELAEKMIELHALNLDWEQVTLRFQDAARRFGYSKISSESLRYVAQAYQQLGRTEQFHETLENLAGQFPHTNDARWAFHWLQDLSCERLPNPYLFSESLLRRLSWNTQVYPDLKNFILGVIEDRRVKLTSAGAKNLDVFDRIRLLMSMRFFEDTEKLGQEILAQRGQYSKRKIQEVQELLAKNAVRMANPQRAAEYFVDLMADNPNYAPSDNYSLADAMRYLGKYKTAHQLYRNSRSYYDRRENAWQQFWMAYKAADYDAALKMMNDHEEFITSRDTDGKVGPMYWRAKIYEQQGKKEEARELYKQVLAQAGQNYYSTIIIRHHPELLKELRVTDDEITKQLNRKARNDILLASLDSDVSPVVSAFDGELKQIEELITHNLKESARQKLFNMVSQTNLNNAMALKTHILFNKAGDYEPKTSLLSKLNVLDYESSGSLSDLNNDQQVNNENWRVYFPRAYEEIVEKFAKQFEIEPLFFLSVMRAESYYREHASSLVGARGLVQIMPFTGVRIAKDLGDDMFSPVDLGNPMINIAYGAFYLSKLLQYYKNNQYVALAAYNAGPDAVNFWLKSCKSCEIDEFVESIPYRETRRYVKKVSKYHQMYQNIYQRPSQFSNWPELPEDLGPIAKIY